MTSSAWTAAANRVKDSSDFSEHLDQVFDVLAGRGLLPQNPLRAEWLKRLLPKRKKTDGRFATLDDAPLTPATVQALLNKVEIPLMRRARYALVFTAPLRDGEIAGLQKCDAHLDTPIPYIDVNKACVLNHKDGFGKLGLVKKEWSNRKLPLTPCALAGLRQWLEEGWEELVGRPPRSEDPIFPREDGKFGRPDSAKFLQQDLKTAGLPHVIDGTEIHFHDARGCVATWLTNAKVEGVFRDNYFGRAATITLAGSAPS